MNRQKLTELLQYPERVSARDASLLSDMAAQYPFATVIRVLIAKSKQQQADAREALAIAALYSPSRQVLRQVMEGNHPAFTKATEADTLAPATEALVETQPQEPGSPTGTLPEPTEEQKKNVDVFDELQKNLRRLRSERSKFYQSAEEIKKEPQPEEIKQDEGEVAGNFIPESPALQQIMQQHQPQTLENPRVQEQRNLIDSFLENASTLPRRQSLNAPPLAAIQDLTEHLGTTPPDLATETLARIMERQGKTEKAIDIYQKLILKYPQKSAYFADCIERLKKNL